MLVAEPIPTQKSERYLCLDLLKTTFQSSPPAHSEAILVEVWSGGGLLHTDCAALPDCKICITTPAGAIKANAVSCTKEVEGYVIEFAVAPDQRWFPEAYRPPYFMPSPAE